MWYGWTPALGRRLGLVFSHTTQTIGLYPICTMADNSFVSKIAWLVLLTGTRWRMVDMCASGRTMPEVNYEITCTSFE